MQQLERGAEVDGARVVGVAAGADERPVEERGPEPLAAGEHERAQLGRAGRAGPRRRGPSARSRRRAGGGPGPRSPRRRRRGWAGPEPARWAPGRRDPTSRGTLEAPFDAPRFGFGDAATVPNPFRPGSRRSSGAGGYVAGHGRRRGDHTADRRRAGRPVVELRERRRPLRAVPPRAAGRVAEWFVPEPVDCVVDLGAGTGALTRLLTARARTSSRSSPTTGCARCSRPRCPGPGRSPAGRGDPVPDGSAQGVFASSSWHWMDPVPTLAEIHRVLVPGGVFGAVWTGPDPGRAVHATGAGARRRDAATGTPTARSLAGSLPPAARPARGPSTGWSCPTASRSVRWRSRRSSGTSP